MHTFNSLLNMSKEDLVQIILNLQYKNKILHFYKTLKNSNEIAISIVVTKIGFVLKINYEVKMNIYSGEIERINTIEVNLKEEIEFKHENILAFIEDKCEMQFFPYRNKTSNIIYDQYLDFID